MPDIFIHSFRFTEHVHLVVEGPRCLSAEELARAARFKVESARQEFIVAHCLLRQTLSRYLQTETRSISYRYGEHGKPYLDAPAAQSVHFSLSHSGDRLLIAVCRDAKIGVDIELVQDRSNPDRLARLCMSRDEAQQLARLTDPVAQRDCFFSLWTRKEAFIKALGKGLFYPPNKTGLQEIAQGVHLAGSQGDPDYRVIDLKVDADYKAAVAVHMDGDSVADAIAIKVLEE